MTLRERAVHLVARLSLDGWLGDDIWSDTGKPTKSMRLVESDGDGWKVLVNMSHPCAGNGMRGVLVRRMDGEEICERFDWSEVAAARARERAERDEAKR